jgi:hypothetical protein
MDNKELFLKGISESQPKELSYMGAFVELL